MGSVQDEDEDMDEADEADEAQELFENLGFADVRVSRAPLPAHLIAWASAALQSEGIMPEEFQSRIPYYRVETAAGTFGFLDLVHPALDLTGTGVTVSELSPGASEAIGVELLAGPAVFEFAVMERLRERLRALANA